MRGVYMSDIKEISLDGLIADIANGNYERYCFILGAGASVTSGIGDGGTLAKKWLDQMKGYEPKLTGKWHKEMKVKGKNIKKDPGQYYSAIYKKRFENPSDGYLKLHEEMESASPSIGYYYLAQILANTKNNLVITTNFDTMTEDAVSFCTNKKALVITHESLAQYIFTEGTGAEMLERPIVAKLHGDFFFRRANTQEDANELSPEWLSVLEKIMEIYTPVVIGYGGNDGGFMEFLRNAAKKDKPIYWCGIWSVNDSIKSLLDLYNGYFVNIDSFDETMFTLGERCGFTFTGENSRDVYYKMKKQSAVYYKMRGDGYYELKQYDKAMDDFMKVIELDPDYVATYFNRSYDYRELNQHSKAIKDFNKAIEREPNSKGYLKNLEKAINKLSYSKL